MRELLSYGKTLTDAYHGAILGLEKYGEEADCGAWNDTQIEVSMTMHVEDPLGEPAISKCFVGGPEDLQQYVMEMLDGILDFEVERGNWAYTYHQRYADQIQFVIDELKQDPSSRRAVMTVRDKDADMGSGDPACLQHIQYFVRGGKLCSIVLFRSNDACKAAFMNAYALIRLQKRIADALELPMGTYSHRANSFHCYGKDKGLLKGYTTRITKAMEEVPEAVTGIPCGIEIFSFTDPEEEVTYEYEDGWDELMEGAIPDIMKKVETLKSRPTE